jgi:hypothetical protein
MNEKLVRILFESGISWIAGIYVTYLGFLSPVFRRSSERLAPDRWVGTFRVLARIAGPVLCILAGLRIFIDFRDESASQVLEWREITSNEGRFRVSSPADFIKTVRDIPYGSESYFKASLPKLGFLVSYVDLPAGLRNSEPEKLLNGELDINLQAAGLELLGRESIRFAGYPAVRFKLRNTSGGFLVTGVLLVAKERRYQLAFQFTSESLSQSGEPFFDSFQVLDRP